MADANKPFYGDEIPAEKVTAADALSEGGYVAAIGKVYRDQTKNGNMRTVVELVLMKGPDEATFVDGKEVSPGKLVISLKKKNDNVVTDNVIYKISFFDIRSDMSKGAKWYAGNQRQTFAKKLGCWNEVEEKVEWGAIQKSLGKVITFSMFKDASGKYLNVDFENLMLLPSAVVVQDSVIGIYTDIEEHDKKFEEEMNAPPKVDDTPF